MDFTTQWNAPSNRRLPPISTTCPPAAYLRRSALICGFKVYPIERPRFFARSPSPNSELDLTFAAIFVDVAGLGEARLFHVLFVRDFATVGAWFADLRLGCLCFGLVLFDHKIKRADRLEKRATDEHPPRLFTDVHARFPACPPKNNSLNEPTMNRAGAAAPLQLANQHCILTVPRGRAGQLSPLGA